RQIVEERLDLERDPEARIILPHTFDVLASRLLRDVKTPPKFRGQQLYCGGHNAAHHPRALAPASHQEDESAAYFRSLVGNQRRLLHRRADGISSLHGSSGEA